MGEKAPAPQVEISEADKRSDALVQAELERVQSEIKAEAKEPAEEKGFLKWLKDLIGWEKRAKVAETQEQTSILLNDVEHTESEKTKLNKIIEEADEANPMPEPAVEIKKDEIDLKEQRRLAANDRAKEIKAEDKVEHIVDEKDNLGLGAIVKGLTGKLDYGMTVDYQSKRGSLAESKIKLADAKYIYEGQHVWIEGETVVVSDEGQKQPEAEINEIRVGTSSKLEKKVKKQSSVRAEEKSDVQETFTRTE